MESFLHIYSAHSPTLQLHPKCFPFIASKASSFSSPPIASLRTIVADRKHAGLTWVRMQQHSPALIRFTAFSSGGDGGDSGHYEDNWYAMDASEVKAFIWLALQKWGVPVAVGAMVGSVVARQVLVLALSFSFLMFMGGHKVLEVQGGDPNRVSDVFYRHTLLPLLNTTKLIALLYLPRAIMACHACIRRVGMCISLLRAIIMVRLRSLVPNKQGYVSQQESLLSFGETQLLLQNVPNSPFESQPNSTDALISDINVCIQKVEGMIIQRGKNATSKSSWNELRENVALLKVMVENIPQKSDEHYVKTKNKVDKVLTNSSVRVLQQDTMRQNPVELDMAKNLEEDLSLRAHVTGKDSSNLVAILASNDAMLDHERVSGSTETSGNYCLTSPIEPLDTVASMKIGENQSRSGMLSNAQRSKYVDYWTQQDKNVSEISSEFSFLSGAEQQENTERNLSCNPRRGILGTASDRTTQRRSDFKAPIPYTDGKNLWIDESQPSGSTGSSDLVKVSLNGGDLAEQIIGGQKFRDGRQDLEASTFELKSSDVEQVAPTSRELSVSAKDEIEPRKHDLTEGGIRETRQDSFENKAAISNGSVNAQLPTQRKVIGSTQKNCQIDGNTQKSTQIDGNTQENHAEQHSAALLGSTKELAFVRDDPDMHVLTGFSRRINNEEFQRLMTEGETALKNGKAGLLGKIEVGEGESLLDRAADLFSSAAAMDPSSVEALGFWGNTLLVHGELKLMLSRELRCMISTPDVISSYQIRRNRVTETSERSHRAAALQQSLQEVCEECEELLIQAGRKYRMVLSISNSEIRALYNWGLALCFRAQLIAEEGGQNAREAADRIYLAAIDKFEAMMGISRRYAPGAMLNWGLTLRDRSRLRAMGSKERIDLLLQAKQLFEDALRLQPGDTQILSAFTMCRVELTELQERKELPSKKSSRSFFGKW